MDFFLKILLNLFIKNYLIGNMYKYIFIILFFFSTITHSAGTSSDSISSDNSDQIKILYEKAEKYIEEKRKMIININLFNGLILILKSSKNPTKNIKLLIKIYSIKIFE